MFKFYYNLNYNKMVDGNVKKAMEDYGVELGFIALGIVITCFTCYLCPACRCKK